MVKNIKAQKMALTLNPSNFYSLYRPYPCNLRLYLSYKGVPPTPPSEFEEVIFKLGHRHEKNHLSTFPDVSDLTGQPAESTIEEIPNQFRKKPTSSEEKASLYFIQRYKGIFLSA